jgi:acetyl-CoA synthetase
LTRGGSRLLLCLLLLSSAAAGQTPEEHFGQGLKLFQAKNFAGALAEFEEAYRLRPTPSSLQNIALCQRALFRYAEAIATLEKMLKAHQGAVEPEDERAAREAIAEMQPMVAVVRIRIEPPDATVRVDDRVIPGGGEREVRLNVGEHRVEAEAPRHRGFEQVMSFAGGPRSVEIRLEANVAELTVVAEDAEAAIAIDGVPRSFGAWTGELEAGEHHVIQVYRTGFTTTTLEVTLARGERRVVRAALGPPTTDPNDKTPFPYTPPPVAPQRRGVFGLLTATSYVITPDPDGFRLPSNDGRDGSYFGLRLGYRFTNTFGLEASGEFGKHNIGPGCYTPPSAPGECPRAPADGATYEFWGRRFGVHARFMTPGERFRFVAVTGVGGAHHRLDLRSPVSNGRLLGTGSALNAYLLVEAGVELSFGRALVGGMLAVTVDGISNLRVGEPPQRVYSDARNITMVGLGLRVGYGHWLPTQEASMSDDQAIVSRLNELRRFPPPDTFRQRARIPSREAYDALYRESLESPETFWKRETQGLVFREPWSALSRWEPPHARWFEGARLNLTESCLDQHLTNGNRNKAAIIWEGEPEKPHGPPDLRTLTYFELHREVVRLAGAIASLGVGKGDRVVIYMGMVPEAAIAMLACARLGAIHSVVFGGFAAEALRDRINDCGARLVITQDGALRRGNVVPTKETVDRALEHCPTVEHVIVHRRLSEAQVTMRFVHGRDILWDDAIAQRDPALGRAPEIVDAEHPLFILYTSGSTGKPKGVLHTTAGYLVGTHVTSKYVFDLRPEDVFWCTADIGWITGHSYVVYGPLSNGATVLMYEGAPNAPDPGRFWRIIERHGVTILYTAPTAIRAFMRWGEDWPRKYDLSSLRLLGSVGEPINPEAWIWYQQHIGGGRCPIVDTWWQTETGSILLTTLPGAVESKPGATGLPFFGVEPAIVKKDGSPCAPNEGGLLILRRPWPSILRTVWGDDERFRKQYFSDIPGVYFTGDGARRDEDGYHWVVGRIDDVLNVAGHRVGTAEIESAVVSYPAVAEAAAVGRPDDLKGQALVVFVTLKLGHAPSTVLRDAIKEQVAREIGKFAAPDDIRFTDALPKTRSGKIMRRLLKEVAAGRQATGDMSTLEDFSVLASLSKDDE